MGRSVTGGCSLLERLSLSKQWSDPIAWLIYRNNWSWWSSKSDDKSDQNDFRLIWADLEWGWILISTVWADTWSLSQIGGNQIGWTDLSFSATIGGTLIDAYNMVITWNGLLNMWLWWWSTEYDLIEGKYDYLSNLVCFFMYVVLQIDLAVALPKETKNWIFKLVPKIAIILVLCSPEHPGLVLYLEVTLSIAFRFLGPCWKINYSKWYKYANLGTWIWALGTLAVGSIGGHQLNGTPCMFWAFSTILPLVNYFELNQDNDQAI